MDHKSTIIISTVLFLKIASLILGMSITHISRNLVVPPWKEEYKVLGLTNIFLYKGGKIKLSIFPADSLTAIEIRSLSEEESLRTIHLRKITQK